MPCILRLLPAVGYQVAKRFGRLCFYADHPEAAPLAVRYAFTHELCLAVIKAFRIRFVVRGLANVPAGQAVFCPNHQSDFDAPALMMLFGRRMAYMAKKAIANYPVIDQMVRATDSFYIDRNDLRSEIKTIRAVAAKLKSDPALLFAIWPEGTRTKDVVNRSVGTFKPGAFKAAYYAETTIVPVAMFGSFRLLEFSRKDRPVYPLQVTFLKPLAYGEYKDLSTVELAAKVQAAVAEEVARQAALQPVLEDYWARPENARAYRRESRRRLKAYRQARKAERIRDRKLTAEWRRTHPLGKTRYRPVVWTAKDRQQEHEIRKAARREKRRYRREARH